MEIASVTYHISTLLHCTSHQQSSDGSYLKIFQVRQLRGVPGLWHVFDGGKLHAVPVRHEDTTNSPTVFDLQTNDEVELEGMRNESARPTATKLKTKRGHRLLPIGGSELQSTI
jgi:hypothetical protein